VRAFCAASLPSTWAAFLIASASASAAVRTRSASSDDAADQRADEESGDGGDDGDDGGGHGQGERATPSSVITRWTGTSNGVVGTLGMSWQVKARPTEVIERAAPRVAS
jgi:hypothetical protein